MATRAGRISVNVSARDKHLFISDEGAGTITVLDLATARASGFAAVLSLRGDTAYVTVWGGNAVLAFDTAKLASGANDAQIGSVPTGPNPIGVAVLDEGRKLIVTNSNRFGATAAEPEGRQLRPRSASTSRT
jgi:DNA-binding beta-propeller fold protein YncE